MALMNEGRASVLRDIKPFGCASIFRMRSAHDKEKAEAFSFLRMPSRKRPKGGRGILFVFSTLRRFLVAFSAWSPQSWLC
jgi:hypothetical protein